MVARMVLGRCPRGTGIKSSRDDGVVWTGPFTSVRRGDTVAGGPSSRVLTCLIWQAIHVDKAESINTSQLYPREGGQDCGPSGHDHRKKPGRRVYTSHAVGPDSLCRRLLGPAQSITGMGGHSGRYSEPRSSALPRDPQSANGNGRFLLQEAQMAWGGGGGWECCTICCVSQPAYSHGTALTHVLS